MPAQVLSAEETKTLARRGALWGGIGAALFALSAVLCGSSDTSAVLYTGVMAPLAGAAFGLCIPAAARAGASRRSIFAPMLGGALAGGSLGVVLATTSDLVSGPAPSVSMLLAIVAICSVGFLTMSDGAIDGPAFSGRPRHAASIFLNLAGSLLAASAFAILLGGFACLLLEVRLPTVAAVSASLPLSIVAGTVAGALLGFFAHIARRTSLALRSAFEASLMA